MADEPLLVLYMVILATALVAMGFSSGRVVFSKISSSMKREKVDFRSTRQIVCPEKNKRTQ